MTEDQVAALQARFNKRNEEMKVIREKILAAPSGAEPDAWVSGCSAKVVGYYADHPSKVPAVIRAMAEAQ